MKIHVQMSRCRMVTESAVSLLWLASDKNITSNTSFSSSRDKSLKHVIKHIHVLTRDLTL